MSEPTPVSEPAPVSEPTPVTEDSAAPDPELAIRVDDVHIHYEILNSSRAGLRSRLVDRNLAGRTTVHAIRGVSFDVAVGEAVGIVGSNGSGKSTILSAIAGVLPVTSGQILASAEPRLMGVGAALIPLASGYRNLRLGCLALGMTADEVDRKIDELVEFTELGDAIHRPLNTYSSGMRARVHFAVATARAPKILLIDEALAVGDRRFRAKAKTQVESIIESAGTLLMVNHSLNELSSYCSRGLWLEEGTLLMDGPMEAVIEAYSADD